MVYYILMKERLMNNNGCLTCGKQTEPSIRNGIPKKYCSKKCAQKFYQSEGRYYKKKNKDWGTRAAKKAAAKEERRKNFEWYKENWLTADQVGETLGICRSAVHMRAKTAGILPKIVTGGDAPTAFWKPADVEKMRDKIIPIPEGYITRKEACQIYNVVQIRPDMIWKQTHGQKSTQHLYLKKRIEKLAFEKQEAARILKEQKEEQERREQEAKILKKLLREQQQEQKKQEKIALKEQKRKEREEKRLISLARKRERERNLQIKRDDDWQYWKVREQRLFNNFEKKLKKYENNELKYKQHSMAIEKNKHYQRLLENGVTHKIICNCCGIEQPYYNFYYDETSSIGRRKRRCRNCFQKIAKKNYWKNKEKLKEQRKKNYRGKFRTIFATTIKKDISRMTGEYAKDLSTPHIWEKIEQNCGYSIEDFVEHFESLFEEGMTWDNHGKGGKGDKIWQVDHIIARNKFFFISLDDENFIKCWSLSNLQPLWAYDNQLKNIIENDLGFDNAKTAY